MNEQRRSFGKIIGMNGKDLKHESNRAKIKAGKNTEINKGSVREYSEEGNKREKTKTKTFKSKKEKMEKEITLGSMLKELTVYVGKFLLASGGILLTILVGGIYRLVIVVKDKIISILPQRFRSKEIAVKGDPSSSSSSSRDPKKPSGKIASFFENFLSNMLSGMLKDSIAYQGFYFIFIFYFLIYLFLFFIYLFIIFYVFSLFFIFFLIFFNFFIFHFLKFNIFF